ncbi:hypothetical protein PLESTB_000703400 [Pleodorina starrii]|uniref:SWIM-type domain-containing protein n=1 Tax=Pleodorina starrii TaxID=330485 RepID=A0A9W6BJC7_9CHLO|nr:hypothetical protein PLESTM_001213300 [Pleodorina starrii]GLC53058.1 hypothetical protein PLESTB_000703400 [Pleodorina starrii]GLC74996.1 hypothetical protein PLESTF_001581800 [Pleodorina starrii]
MQPTTAQNATRPPRIARAGDACFAEFQELINQNPNIEIPDETLASLHMLYGKNFAKALEVVDSGGIVCFVGERTGRTVYKVPGSRPPDQYLVFPSHYCSCQSFLYDVVGRSEAVCCKHQLAARLATVLRRAVVVRMCDVELARMLLGQCE